MEYILIIASIICILYGTIGLIRYYNNKKEDIYFNNIDKLIMYILVNIKAFFPDQTSFDNIVAGAVNINDPSKGITSDNVSSLLWINMWFNNDDGLKLELYETKNDLLLHTKCLFRLENDRITSDIVKGDVSEIYLVEAFGKFSKRILKIAKDNYNTMIFTIEEKKE